MAFTAVDLGTIFYFDCTPFNRYMFKVHFSVICNIIYAPSKRAHDESKLC